MNKVGLYSAVIVVVIAAIMSSLFIVDEREKALVLHFGPGCSGSGRSRDGVPVYFYQVVTYDWIISIDMEAQSHSRR
jgi:membrane protease subunit HflC